MHELSIALSIIDVATEEARRQGDGRVVGVHLRLGHLAGVIPEALQSAWPVACEDTPLAGCQLVIEEVAVTIDCPACGGVRPARSIQEICCAHCGSAPASIVTGRELEVAALELREES